MIKQLKIIFPISFILIASSNYLEARSFGYQEPIKFYFGLNMGPLLAWNADINSQNTRSEIGFNIGAETINTFQCGNCRNLMLETSLNYEHLGEFLFGPTQFRNSRVKGSYKETLYILHGNMGLRYYFANSKKLSPFVSFAPGIYYIKVKSASFNDFTGNDLDTNNLKRSHINFGFGIGLGVSYKLSYRILLEFYPKWHLFFPLGFKNTFIQFPLTFKYLF